MSAVARQMLSTATHSYDTFQSVVSDAIHGESGLQQIASMFQLCRAAIEHAGTGTELAVSIKNMAMQYFEQYFAPWVVEQGGWVSLQFSLLMTFPYVAEYIINKDATKVQTCMQGKLGQHN